jgi:hypothetical protein
MVSICAKQFSENAFSAPIAHLSLLDNNEYFDSRVPADVTARLILLYERIKEEAQSEKFHSSDIGSVLKWCLIQSDVLNIYQILERYREEIVKWKNKRWMNWKKSENRMKNPEMTKNRMNSLMMMIRLMMKERVAGSKRRKAHKPSLPEDDYFPVILLAFFVYGPMSKEPYHALCIPNDGENPREQ